MTVRAVWCLVAVWSAGLLAGQTLPIIIRWLLLAFSTRFLFHSRFRRLNRIAALLLLFLLASLAGARVGIGINIGTQPEETGYKHGLSNPHFRPLIRIAVPDSAGTDPPVRTPTARPPWASGPVWGLVQATLLNRRDALPYEWTAAFRSAGAAHLIAISGLHIGILLGILLALLRVAQIGRVGAAITAIASSWLYIVLIGAPPSAVRAGLMASIGLAIWGAGRLPQPERILPTAVLAALVIRPALIASVGFQLSVFAVIGIGLALRGFRTRDLESVRGRLSALFRITLGAQAGVLPIQILTFGYISPLAPLVNVVAVPFMGVWLPSAAAALCSGFLWAPAASLAGAFCEGIGRLLLWWICLWSDLPGIVVPAPTTAALTAAAGLALWVVGRKGRVAALACLVAVVWLPAFEKGVPRVSFLDVGQGDAIVIETENPRRVVVVDSGPAFHGWSAGRYVVAGYLRARGIRKIDLLVASHPDVDHIGGMEALAEEFQIEFFMRGDWCLDDTGSALRLMTRLEAAGVETIMPVSGDRIVLDDGSYVDVLGGVPSEGEGGGPKLSSNDRSLVLRLQLHGLSVLLCGDLEKSGEGRLIPYARFLQSTILKVPHHGSEDVLSDGLLSAIRPSMAVISVGRRNRYGHPSEMLLHRLRNAEIDIWRTDNSGALVLQARD